MLLLRRLLLPALGLLAALSIAAPAHGQTLGEEAWESCSPRGFKCTLFPVPLDRANPSRGTVSLSIHRRRATNLVDGSSTAILTLTGGPGQPAEPFAADFATLFSKHLGSYDLLVYDQRGTGSSGQLKCPSLASSRGSISTVVQACAARLGSRRAFYRTSDTVEDIEAIRKAAGYSKLIIYGVSYGTRVAEAYARAYPARTESLILDSIVAPDGPDAFNRDVLGSMERVLGESLCGDGACTDATPDVVADVRRLATRMRTRPVTGSFRTSSGKAVRARVGLSALYGIILSGDMNPVLRSELPGAVRAALGGDAAPLLRLAALASAGGSSGRFADGDVSEALYLATMCEETRFPWSRSATLTQRRAQALSFVKAQSSTAWGLFPQEIGLDGLPTLCIGWQPLTPAPPQITDLPDVPTLLLSGEADLRTSNEVAVGVADLLPRSRLLLVPYTGHSVLGSELGTCAQSAVDRFLQGGSVQDCTAESTENAVAVSPKPPRSLANLSRVGGLPTRVGRTVNAVVATMRDARLQVLGGALATGNLPRRVAGLRGGTMRVSTIDRGRMSNLSYVPGMRISGVLNAAGTSVITVRGRAATGTLRITRDGVVTGRLDGTRVSLRPATAARATTGGDELSRQIRLALRRTTLGAGPPLT